MKQSVVIKIGAFAPNIIIYTGNMGRLNKVKKKESKNVKIKRYSSPGSTLAIFCISPQIFKSRSGFPLISASALRLWSFYTKNTQKLLLRVAMSCLTICTKNDIISLQV